MKNILASILLIAALLLSLFLFRSGKQYQDSLTQEPMTASLLDEKEKNVQEKEISDPGAAGEDISADPAEGTEAPIEEKPPEEEMPSRAEDLARLRETLSERISQTGGDWSLYVKYLPTGEDCSIDSRPMVAASLIKLFVAGTYLEAVDLGEIQDQYDASLTSMLSQSDNEAANRLINLLGMDRVNAFIQKHGFADTQLNRLMLANNGLENYTSVKDCAELLGQVYAGTFVNRRACERILSAMKEQRVVTKIPAGLPEGTVCANKTGELSRVENDTAVIYSSGGDYIFCVMSDRVSPGTAQSEIAEMSRIIYETLGAEKEDDEAAP